MAHIFLYGPPGSGKSVIGQVLAGNLNLPFIDLDRVIETTAGMSIPRIMEQRGESAFRDLESSVLKDTASKGEGVVALGGGALLRDDNRALAEDSGRVVCLSAELAALIERLENDPVERPLLTGDLRMKLSSLLAARREHYLSFPLKILVDGKTAGQSSLEIQVLLGRYHLSAMGEYDVLVQNGGIGQIGSLLSARGMQNPIIVTDENAGKFHAENLISALRATGFDPKVLTLPAGENHKNLETISRLWRAFLEAGLDRKSTVLAFGGGVIGDMAGFAASTFMRGIAWVGVPTTLLSMVDASLGGKTGFDLPQGKNLIGSFHPPMLVLADPDLLGTLPEGELISGLAEVVKHGLISDPELFALCSRGMEWVKNHIEEIIKRAMAVKVKVIEQDPYEKGGRAVLNLGHTVGHAVEFVSRYTLRHGEAVAIGMTAEAGYSARIGLASSGLVEAVSASLSGLGLPVRIPAEMPRLEILRAMRMDKKRNSQFIRMALPVEIGKVELVDVTDLDPVLE